MLRHVTRSSLLCFLLAAFWLPAAWAQTPRPVPMPDPQPNSQPSPPAPAADPAPAPEPRPAAFGPWWRDSRLSSEIDLGAPTIDQLEQLFLDHRLRLADLAEELDRSRAAVDFQRHRSEPDTSALQSAEDELFELRGQIEAARTELLVEIRALLTAEQWTQLSDYQRRHRPRAPEAPSAPRPPRPGPPDVAPAPPAPESPPSPESAVSRGPRPTKPPRPPATAAAPSPPSAPLPPAPPALSWWTEPEVRAELGLDADQLRALESATEGSAEQLRALQDTLRREEGELTRMVNSQHLDRDAARAQVERVTLARRELLDAGRDLERRLLEILTPQQRQRLDTL